VFFFVTQNLKRTNKCYSFFKGWGVNDNQMYRIFLARSKVTQTSFIGSWNRLDILWKPNHTIGRLWKAGTTRQFVRDAAICYTYFIPTKYNLNDIYIWLYKYNLNDLNDKLSCIIQMLAQLDIHLQKDEIGSLSHTKYQKTQLKMD
jgi:hypothetical protein